jgi:DNA-binding response OmpR family regulator
MNAKLLIADDNRRFVELLGARLASEGFRIDVAYDGVQALNLALRERPDAVLLEVGMPGGSGLETLKRLKRSSVTQGIPVIVLSGVEDAALPEAVTALGAAGFLQKPVSYREIRDCLLRSLLQARPAA